MLNVCSWVAQGEVLRRCEHSEVAVPWHDLNLLRLCHLASVFAFYTYSSLSFNIIYQVVNLHLCYKFHVTCLFSYFIFSLFIVSCFQKWHRTHFFLKEAHSEE